MKGDVIVEIKVLFENSRINLNFKSGHGLSLLINYSGKKYLFDAGANKKLVYNATKMGETLNDLEAVIISHGHSDHTGGLRWFCCKVLNLLS
ncbi:TPA: MBL fold metallo-hydrolase, partial [Enterococcus faecium]|nr:MBL fold metallo-hydrolase [Enterococcus faecium]